MAIAPEHPLLEKIDNPELKKFIEKIKKQSSLERTADDKVKEGFDTGLKIVNPFTGELVPLYAGNFVLMEYGTGAIMSVPAHDSRDFAFAKKYNLPIKLVIDNPNNPIDVNAMTDAYIEDGINVNSTEFNGIANAQAKEKISDYAEKQGFGKRRVNYRLRDWGISRQRYWGCPIPIIYCEHCGVLPVPEKDLPVILPIDVEFHNDSRSPLGKLDSFLKVKCPKCGLDAKRETDTMDTFVDSSWYYARYTSKSDTEIFEKDESQYWMPVDQYIGGVEHAVLHLLYARFFSMVLHDLGLLNQKEPFKKLLTQGMVIKDGWKMSKSKGNVVDPDEIVSKYGADTARLFILFAAPPQKDLDWSDKGVEGAFRFINRVWRFVNKYASYADYNTPLNDNLNDALKAIRIELHRTLKIVTGDIEERMQYNTAIARMMELTNSLYSVNENEWNTLDGKTVLAEIFNIFIPMLYPFTPHAAEELWKETGHLQSLALASWPKFIDELTTRDEIEIVFQINVKIKGKINAPSAITKEEMEKAAMSHEKIAEILLNKQIIKTITVPGKLVNIVIAN
jgi:leucyl-tRNA synthetase